MANPFFYSGRTCDWKTAGNYFAIPVLPFNRSPSNPDTLSRQILVSPLSGNMVFRPGNGGGNLLRCGSVYGGALPCDPVPGKGNAP